MVSSSGTKFMLQKFYFRTFDAQEKQTQDDLLRNKTHGNIYNNKYPDHGHINSTYFSSTQLFVWK